MQVLLAVVALLLLMVAVFAFQNPDPVTIRFLFWQLSASVAVVTIASAAAGALAAALASGRPRGAYLDVTEPEPLPAEHPLWRTPNVVISGHSAGRSPRPQQRYTAMFLDNLQRFQSGQPLKNLVDYSAGY